MKAINLLSHYIYQGIIQSSNILVRKKRVEGGKKEERKWKMGIIHHKYQADRKEPY